MKSKNASAFGMLIITTVLSMGIAEMTFAQDADSLLESLLPDLGSNARAVVGQEEETSDGGIRWQDGPGVGALGSIAEIIVPVGYVFTDGAQTRRLMELMQNPTSGNELGFLAPAGEDWFVVFEFDDVGFIRDDEKNDLDANAMLKAIRKGNDAANKERVRRGWSTLSITGWEQPPRYNQATHNLEWAIRGVSNGAPVVNWNTRLLGRGGVMSVTLVADADSLPRILPRYSMRLADFAFTPGHRYAEFREGDKLAEYGLSALVVGGATAVAVKTGAAKWLWKLIVLGVAAVAAFFKKLFSRGKKIGGTLE